MIVTNTIFKSKPRRGDIVIKKINIKLKQHNQNI